MSARILLTGATGFVGRHLYPVLRTAGYETWCATRTLEDARRRAPERHWVHLDLDRPETFPHALEGCDGVVYLVHAMGGGAGYAEREAASAHAFARAAADAGVRRIVYLGGPASAGHASPHLASRLRTGAILRASDVPTVELRAAMIVGAGGASWRMVRDLAKRLPAMVLPSWLRNHSWPIAIDDVVFALAVALELPDRRAGWYDLPGPERMSHREMLRRVVAIMQRRPVMVGIPLLTPRLSSYWIGLVTQGDLHMAQQLVQGLRYDLDPTGPSAWAVLPSHELTPFDEAVRFALDDERFRHELSPGARGRLEQIGRSLRATEPSPATHLTTSPVTR